jgi:hypothetical protein
MATARRQVKNLCNVGHKGKDDKEADVVSDWCYSSIPLCYFIFNCCENCMYCVNGDK